MEWILCSERLPKVGEEVLVQVVWDSCDMMVGYINTTRNGWVCQLGFYDFEDIIAWMPLPEIYKG